MDDVASLVDVDMVDDGLIEVEDTDPGFVDVNIVDDGLIEVEDTDAGFEEVGEAEEGFADVADAEDGFAEVADADVAALLDVAEADAGLLDETDAGKVDLLVEAVAGATLLGFTDEDANALPEGFTLDDAVAALLLETEAEAGLLDEAAVELAAFEEDEATTAKRSVCAPLAKP